MAQALFKHWFVDFGPFQDGEFVESKLGLMPEGWKVGRLSDFCVTQYGFTESAKDDPVGPKFLRVKDINKQDWIDWETVPYCTISDDEKPKYVLEVGDVVVARMADPGKSAIVEQDIDAVFASYLVRLKSKSLAHSYFVYGFLKSRAYSEYCEGAMSGSVQQGMNAKVIVAVELVLPPDEVMGLYLTKVIPLRRLLIANLQEMSALTTTRDYLLPKLLSREVAV
jgi:type I restriction enzyme S subunit